MSMYVACPDHVRCADLGSATVLVDLRTGRVEVLLGWAHQLCLALARAPGDAAALTQPMGVSRMCTWALIRKLCEAELLTEASAPRPWPVAVAPRTRSSWGTQEVSAAVYPPARLTAGRAILAGFALGAVLTARHCGRRSRSFTRITTLLTAATRRPAVPATTADVSHALHCVRAVASVLPARVACLEDTAAAMLVLALRGRRAGWCHGIAADPIRLHAWIALHGRPVAEPDSAARYTPLLQIR